MTATNERMRLALATVAIGKRRSSHQHRKWALEANASGDSEKYHRHLSEYLRERREAHEYLNSAKEW